MLTYSPEIASAGGAFSLSISTSTIADTSSPSETFASVPPGDPGTFDYQAGTVSLNGSVAAVSPPNTAVFTFDTMTTSPAGNMFLGSGEGEARFQFVPDHSYINNLGAGASELYVFIFSDGSATATLTITVTGVNDTPELTTFIPDITSDLAEAAFTCEVCNYPSSESPPAAFDDDYGSKYLSFDGDGSDVVIDAGSDYVISALSFVTGNDSPGRDPTEVSVFGSTTGSSGPWIGIETGLSVLPPSNRGELFGPYEILSSDAYRYFKIVFDVLRSDSIFQVAEVSVRGTSPSGLARYVTGDPATIIGGGILLFDDGNARTATASLANPGSMPGDQLGLASGTATGVTASWDPVTRTLSISAPSQAALADALKKLTFVSTETDPSPAGSTRAVTLHVSDLAGVTSEPAVLIVQTPAPVQPIKDPVTGDYPSLVPGESLVYEDATQTPVTITVENLNELVMSNGAFELRLAAQCSSGCEIQTDGSGRQVIELESSGAANVAGEGFQAGSEVDVWLFSSPIYLGQLPVNGSGTFSGLLPLPAIEPGSHTLQVNGISSDGKVRSANLGVIVKRTSSGFNFNYELPDENDTLPATGASPILGTWALALLLTGSVLLIRHRRRHLP
jgi:LPXTG-motif cell wall-anchored protein